MAKAAALPEARIEQLVRDQTVAPDLGLFGTARVNVLLLNLALDALK